MSVDIVSPLRQRMIEDMTARKLGAGTHAPHQQLQAVCRVSATLTWRRHSRGHPPFPAAPRRDRDEHPQPQPHHDRAAVLVPRDAAAAGPCGRDLSPARTAEDSASDQSGRGTQAYWPLPTACGRACCSVLLTAADCVPAKWSGSRSSTSTARSRSFASSKARAARIAMSCSHPSCSICCGNGGGSAHRVTMREHPLRNVGCFRAGSLVKEPASR